MIKISEEKKTNLEKSNFLFHGHVHINTENSYLWEKLLFFVNRGE
jgi:hypothetical protein